MPPRISKAEAQSQRTKLAKSYQELLEEFSAKDLTTVGNYTLGRLIGKGSFGKVYLATHKLTNGSKVVLKSANKDDSNLAREIHHHRQFLHPHIARLYEVIVTEKLVWLVLEYCPGDELYNYLLKHGPLPVDKVQRIFTQLVGAVAYVHGMSCVHRDLKLENILLDKNENVKLCDFGFTREYEGKASYLQTFCGTVCYSAPEMLRGEKYAGEKVDVWSLGVILYALLTGELPFDEDDENATKLKILGNEAQIPERLTAEAKALIGSLLSKRPLLRPSLSEILAHPFLAEHAPNQQAILKVQQPKQFTTKVEKDTLDRMRSAGIDTDKVIENVLAQRCDSLAGWWALLIEKEVRKELRRERKRRERELDGRHSRRVSTASSRMEKIVLPLKEIDESLASVRQPSVGDSPRIRGRRDVPSFSNHHLVLPELPRLSELGIHPPGTSTPPPPPIEKDSIGSRASSRSRPALPPKEILRKPRNSALQLVKTNSELLSSTDSSGRRNTRRRRHPIMSQLAQLKHWLIDSARRAKSPGSKNNSASTASLAQQGSPSMARHDNSKGIDRERAPEKRPAIAEESLSSSRSRDYIAPPPQIFNKSRKRTSLSPAPLTPHSSYRRASSGLRGRKSTSSSVSSIRSIHHHRHSHSKASSTSSASITSSVAKHPRSPRTSIKVLPATPTTSSFPSSIRVSRTGPSYHETGNFEFSDGRLPSPGLIFAKRKKTPFKGPMLSVSTGGGPSRRESSLPRTASASGRRSGEIIEEENEDEIEEVDAFSPITGPHEMEETFDEVTARHGLSSRGR